MGFEPTRRGCPPSGFQDRRARPLREPSWCAHTVSGPASPVEQTALPRRHRDAGAGRGLVQRPHEVRQPPRRPLDGRPAPRTRRTRPPAPAAATRRRSPPGRGEQVGGVAGALGQPPAAGPPGPGPGRRGARRRRRRARARRRRARRRRSSSRPASSSRSVSPQAAEVEVQQAAPDRRGPDQRPVQVLGLLPPSLVVGQRRLGVDDDVLPPRRERVGDERRRSPHGRGRRADVAGEQVQQAQSRRVHRRDPPVALPLGQDDRLPLPLQRPRHRTGSPTAPPGCRRPRRPPRPTRSVRT